jgi:CheY-like chemotaxis protein
VNSQEGQGSIFQLYFPAFTPGEQHLQHQEQVSFGHEETLLLVEDEKAVRTTLRTMLEHLHYRVVEAKNGVEAHALYVDHPEQFDLVIMDLVMPEMGGVALSRTLQQLNPSLPIILMSGYPLGEAEKSLLASGIYHWLPKPPTLQELAQIVHTLLRSPRQGQATHAIDADHQLKEAPLP